MRVEKKIAEDKSFVLTIETLVKAYEEIAVMKMQRVRSRVLSAREFADLITEVFSDVRGSYAAEIERLTKNGDAQKSRRRAGVFISSEARLYGDIIGRIFSLFKADYGKRFDDAVIIGKVGKELMEQDMVDARYEFFESMAGDASGLKTLFDLIRKYDEVIVYYGKFVNVITQQETASIVTGGLKTPQGGEKKTTFFFEPSLGEVLSYFENQVVSSLLLQALHESELAKLASRTKTMEQARVNIADAERALALQLRAARRLKDDRKQQERLSGMQLWR